MGEAVGAIIALILIYFVVTEVDHKGKKYISTLIGTGVGCGAILLQLFYGIIVISLLVGVVNSCS